MLQSNHALFFDGVSDGVLDGVVGGVVGGVVVFGSYKPNPDYRFAISWSV